MINPRIEDYREYYNLYFKEFNRLAVGEYASLSYGKDEPNDTCSSLESIIAYANYIDDHEVSILNAGAGVSSWMFRKLFGWVTCVDPNEKYVNFVQHICKANGINSNEFYKGFSAHGRFDHVYFDYGNIERLPYLGSAIDLARESVYVDDVDTRACCFPYRDITIQLCDALGLKWMDCPESLDSYGRAGIIIIK